MIHIISSWLASVGYAEEDYRYLVSKHVYRDTVSPCAQFAGLDNALVEAGFSPTVGHPLRLSGWTFGTEPERFRMERKPQIPEAATGVTEVDAAVVSLLVRQNQLEFRIRRLEEWVTNGEVSKLDREGGE